MMMVFPFENLPLLPYFITSNYMPHWDIRKWDISIVWVEITMGNLNSFN